eukprot:gene2938-1920_t
MILKTKEHITTHNTTKILWKQHTSRRLPPNLGYQLTSPALRSNLVYRKYKVLLNKTHNTGLHTITSNRKPQIPTSFGSSLCKYTNSSANATTYKCPNPSNTKHSINFTQYICTSNNYIQQIINPKPTQLINHSHRHTMQQPSIRFSHHKHFKMCLPTATTLLHNLET